MSDGTSIEWTDASWNPLRASVNDGPGVGWACVRVSQGCVNCYAATFNKRLGTGLDYTVPALAKVTTYVDEKALRMPLRWRKPRKVFVCSMTDLFGEWVSDADIDRVWNVMHSAWRHTFQVLTKRPERARTYLERFKRTPPSDDFVTRDGVLSNEVRRGPVYIPGGWPLPNVWLGTSVENQATADERIPHLLATPAAVRFLSCEPLLGPVELGLRPLTHPNGRERFGHHVRLDWVIVGGESGPRARPMDLAWARSLVEQCRAAGVTPFVKQIGAKPYARTDEWVREGIDARVTYTFINGDAGVYAKLKSRKGGDPAEWPADLRVRDFPA